MSDLESSLATKKLIAIFGIIILVLALALGGYFLYLQPSTQGKTLTIYTYDSLLAWGMNATKTYDTVFGTFERMHGVKINVVKFDSTGDMISQLLQEGNQTDADVVIGIDNLDVFKFKGKNLFASLASIENLKYIDNDLINNLDPSKELIPYDYGTIALVYNTNLMNETTYPELGGPIEFEDLLLDKFSSQLVIENPTTSSTGASFLLWQISMYSKLYKINWTTFWETMISKPNDKEFAITEGWSDAWDLVFGSNPSRGMMVSYGTDLAYNAYFGYDLISKPLLVSYNGEEYAWLQIEGLAVLKNSDVLDLAIEFANYFLSNTVQSEIALNNWMYPASNNVTLPDVFVNYAIDPSNVNLANNLLTLDEIETNYENWLLTWQQIIAGG